MKSININIGEGEKVYFASDFHLGAPDRESSLAREKRIIKWLDQIKKDAHTLFLVGDIFDFWHEYKRAIPKGFIRFQGKLAELVDSGIDIHFFTGNHDMWMYGYFTQELGIPIHKEPITIQINNTKLYVAHGDGLGPGDRKYKILKKIFNNRLCQWLFRQIHPDLGIKIADSWSASSRISSSTDETTKFLGEGEWLLAYAKAVEKKSHFDYYVFGHRHLPINVEVNKNSRYINLGEWVNFDTFAVFDGKEFVLKKFEGDVINQTLI